MKLVLLLGILFALLDLVVKSFVSTLIPNYGIIFGLFPSLSFISILLSIFFLIVILYWSKTLHSHYTLALSFLFGGTLGNLYDRIVFGYVRDFITLCIKNLCYPSFNLADVFLVFGIILFFIYSRRRSLGT